MLLITLCLSAVFMNFPQLYQVANLGKIFYLSYYFEEKKRFFLIIISNIG